MGISPDVEERMPKSKVQLLRIMAEKAKGGGRV